MHSRSRLKKQALNTPQHSKHIPLLLLAGFNLILLVFIITSKFPTEIADVFVHQAYIPLLLPFFLCTSFLFGFITLNIKQGSIIGLFTTILLLFRLQHIQVALMYIPIALLLCGFLLLLTRKTRSGTTPQLTE